MSCLACGHQPWHHTTVKFPRYSRPCTRLVCCEQDYDAHGPWIAHKPEHCPCRNLQLVPTCEVCGGRGRVLAADIYTRAIDGAPVAAWDHATEQLCPTCKGVVP